MKKSFFVIILLLVSFSLMAQSPFRFEILAGGGVDVWRYSDEGDFNRGRFVLGGACSFLFNDNLDICAKYLFSPTYSPTEPYKYRTHTFTLAGEYHFLRDRNVRPYIAVGAGPQYVHTTASSKIEYHGTKMGILGEVGVEINQRFKISLGSFQHGYFFWNDVHQPFWFLTLGWIL